MVWSLLEFTIGRQHWYPLPDAKDLQPEASPGSLQEET
jgi:hypothetical protein